MRCGQLLAETTPNNLLARFQCATLEEAFLILSKRQKDDKDKGITKANGTINEDEEILTHPLQIKNTSTHNGIQVRFESIERILF